MVFQLITFFVLVVNFKSAELDLTLNLPVVGSARPKIREDTNRLLVLNVKDNKGEVALSVMGVLHRKDAIKPYLERESKSALVANEMTFDDVKDGSKEMKDLMVIRADSKCPFGHVNYVINACQEVGFRNFILKTAPVVAGRPQR
jgi:biopolymer transport protein ExbD